MGLNPYGGKVYAVYHAQTLRKQPLWRAKIAQPSLNNSVARE
jgi:hypothetical protein